MSRPRGAILVLLTLLTGVLLLGSSALGRAGGGGGYSGGGGGGSGGGGSGGGGLPLDALVQWFGFCMRQPLIGWPITFAGVGLVVYLYQGGRTLQQARTIRRGAAALGDAERHAVIEQLRSTDPDFDPDALLGRIETAFEKIQRAWSAQDLSGVRPFISDGVHERFVLQVDEQRALGYRDHMEQVRVRNIVLADFTSHHLFDTLSVRITASAVDYKASLLDARRIKGSSKPRTFVEVWSFLRRRGARTLRGKHGLIEGHCPNCGVSVTMTQFSNCPNCRALLRSGEYDWVLTGITQDCEWRRPSQDEQPGIDAIQAVDPGFNIQSLEDRASVIFHRMATADRLGEIAPLRKLASPTFAGRFAELEFEPLTQAWYGERAVGSVQTLGAIPGHDWDRALVEVRWSGVRFTQQRGQPPRRTGQGMLQRTLLVLGRKTGVKTDIARSISSAHCPRCGAPEVAGDSDACPYCNTVLNDGEHGWILLNAMPSAIDDARQLFAALRPLGKARGRVRTNGSARAIGLPLEAPMSLGALAWMAQMVLVDGTVTDEEREMLELAGAHRHLPARQVDLLLSALRNEQARIPQPRDSTEARQWLTAMASAAYADGRIDPSEKRLLRTAAERAGFGPYDLRLILSQARHDRYRLARQALRRARRRGGSQGA